MIHRSVIAASLCGLFLLALASIALAKFSLGGNSPLPVDDAFSISATADDRDAIKISFDIAEEYFLYRDKTVISSLNDAINLGEPDFPEAQLVNDEFFGETYTYRSQADVLVPISADNTQSSIDINVRFQGCADMGICYPPTDRKLTVALPAALKNSADSTEKQSDSLAALIKSNSGSNTGSDLQQSSLLSKSGSTGLDDLFAEELPLLSPEQAFIPDATVSADNTVTVSWVIEPEYYLYRDKMKFDFADNVASVSNVEFSESTIQFDEFFGDTPVFRHQATATIKVSDVQAAKATLNILSQGCADIGVCYPPTKTSLPVSFNGKLSSGNSDIAAASTGVMAASAQTNAQSDPQTNVAPKAEQDIIRAKLSSSSLWLNAATFFVLGLLLSFTPCVFPMIPILSSLILGQGQSISTTKAFGLSLTYVLAMAVTYTAVGVFIGLSGYNLQAWFQNPWILSVFALIFILLSLSMFGFYEIQMPSSIQNKLNSWSNKQEGGNWIGVAVMGVLSAVIVGPCVTAPLVGALIYIAETGDATVGGVALFSMSLGMGLPLLIIGTSAGKLMPKAGAWMDITKVIFGLTMLAMAIWMLSRFLPANVIVMMSSVLAICGGIYLGTTSRFGQSISWLSWSIGLISTLYGVALILGLLAGKPSLITPLAGLGGGASTQLHEIEFERIKTEADLEQVLQEATANQQYVLFDYYADWCVSCKEMEAFTFTDPAVQDRLKPVRLIQADVTKNDKDDQALLKRFGLFGPPAILFFKPGGTELADARVVGYMKAEKFLTQLNAVLP